MEAERALPSSQTTDESSLEGRRRIVADSIVAKKHISIIASLNEARAQANDCARRQPPSGDASRLATIEHLSGIRRCLKAARILAPALDQYNIAFRRALLGAVPVDTSSRQWEDKYAHELSARRFKSSLFGCLVMHPVRPPLRALAADTKEFLHMAIEECGYQRPENPLVSVAEFGDPATAGEQVSRSAWRLWKGLTMISARYSPPGRAPVPLTMMSDVELMCMQLGMIHHCRLLSHDIPLQPYEWVAVSPQHSSARRILASVDGLELADVHFREAPFMRADSEESEWCSASGQYTECINESCLYLDRCPRKLIARLVKFGPICELNTVIVLPTKSKGNALFSLVDMFKGRAIIGYRGVEYSKAKADERRIAIEGEGLTPYHMDYHQKEPRYKRITVEATVVGSTARFASHACKGVANAYAIGWTCGGTMQIVLVAERDILAGEEITYPYSYVIDDEDTENLDRLTKCMCGGKDLCSGLMGYSIEEAERARLPTSLQLDTPRRALV